MNRTEGKKMRDIFYKYYHGRFIESLEDMEMLDRLLLARHIKYSFKDGRAFAEATDIAKRMHYCPPDYQPSTV
jgi:hypothetical protein